MVEVIRANGIYSSPIVRTTLIKAWLRKKQILALVQLVPEINPVQALVRKGAAEGSSKTGRKRSSRVPRLHFGCGRTVFPAPASTEAISLEAKILRKRFSISDRNAISPSKRLPPFGNACMSVSEFDDSSVPPDSKDRRRNLKLILSYDGAEFSGWQVQPDAATVQGTLASAIGRITGEKVLPQGSGRTDAGVHALAQVMTFVTSSPVPTENFLKALNDILPASVRVLAVKEMPAEFHARRSARGKTYRYRIYRGTICPPFLARYVWHYPYPLNEEAIASAAGLVAGEHDFASFAAVDPERGRDGKSVSNVRTIFFSAWERSGEELVYTVRGSGFLHHMVRNLVGTFILVGRGTLQGDDVRRILEARNRSAAGATAPATGLYLVEVEY
jgi:tRNA pseudouridine38-40 synthase